MELETTVAITDNLLGTFAYGLTNGEFDEYQSGSLENLTLPHYSPGARLVHQYFLFQLAI